jgi:hypothetical protein
MVSATALGLTLGMSILALAVHPPKPRDKTPDYDPS